MKYRGWNFEKTLLIRSDSPFDRRNEFVDVSVAVETRGAGTLARDVRVVLKPAWNRFGQEVPCQVYDIQTHGPVTTFRVAFVMDIPAHSTQRVGILYDNPDAAPATCETDLKVSVRGGAHTVENRHYRVRTDPASGQLAAIIIKLTVLEYTHVKCLTPADHTQGGVRVIFADPADPANARTVSATTWNAPETTCVQGPLFMSLSRRGRLAPPGEPATDRHPSLEMTYRFLADQPFILISSRLEFHDDTPVYGIHNDWITVNKAAFSHYCFRPVTASLPETDVEEAGHILVAPEYTQGLPPGPIFGGFLPYDLAWHAFISTFRKQDFRFDYALTGIRLHEASRAPGGPAPRYRDATYLTHDRDQLAWFRAPVYVRKQDCAANIVTIPRGTVYAETYALHLGEWDEKKNWLNGIDLLGKRLNQPLTITQHPCLLGGTVPPEETPAALMRGTFGYAYTKAGIR
jgi:hypothetical protein